MKIGVAVAQGFDMHFREIQAELQDRHELSVFRPHTWPYQLMSDRINRVLLKSDLQAFIAAQDVTFFEWAEHWFVAATHLTLSSPLIVRLHSHELWDFAPYADWSNVDRAIFVSRAMQRKFLDAFPAMSGRTEVVLNGVRLDRFAYAPRPFRGVIGTLGRIDPHKRVYDLVLALYELRRRGIDLVLHIGGSVVEPRFRRYEEEVRVLVRRLGLNRFVQFQGAVTDTPAWFRDVDIFVSHSCSEGLQVALLEAMASGCYCLAHSWDGVEEVLPPQNRYVTEGELIEKVISFCEASDAERSATLHCLRGMVEERFDIADRKLDVVRIVEAVAGRTVPQ